MSARTSRNISYWIATVLVSVGTFAGGVFDIAHPAEVLAELGHLGYPAYFAPLLGTWKVLGALALIAPGLPRVKEWAYAGIFFDLTAAAISHAASGDPAGTVITPLVGAAVLVVSWALRPTSRKLAPGAVLANA